MKILVTVLVLLFLAPLTFGQKNQAEVAALWADGEYMWSGNTSGSSVTWKEYNLTKVRCIKDSDGVVHTLVLGDNPYVADKEGISTFVRYYTNSSGNRHVYFTGKQIVLFETSNNESIVSIKACLGKQAKGSKMKDVIKKHLASTKEMQAADIALHKSGKHPKSIKGKTIKNVEIELVPYKADKVVTGVKFELGLTTTFSDGTSIKSKNLGGSQCPEDYRFEVEGSWGRTGDRNIETQSQLYDAKECAALINGGIQVKVISRYTQKTVWESNVKFECKGSETEKGKLGDKFMAYDKIEPQTGEPVYTSLAQTFGTKYIVEELQSFFDSKEICAVVIKNDKCGLVNKQGDEILPCIYDHISRKAYEGMYELEKDGKHGFCNEEGNVIPVKYESASWFDGGMARVRLNDKYGFINKKGEAVIDIIYDEANSTQAFGLIGVKKGEKAGFVDKTGKTVIPLRYDKVDMFYDERAAVLKGDKWGYINLEGKLVIDYQFDHSYSFKDGVFYFFDDENHNGEMGKVNLSGEISWESASTESMANNVASSRGASTSSKPSGSSSSSTSSSPSSSSSSASSKPSGPQFTGSIKFINDTGEKYHAWFKAGSGWWASNGSKTSRCEKGNYLMISKDNKRSNAKKVYTFQAGDCGKTIKLKSLL